MMKPTLNKVLHSIGVTLVLLSAFTLAFGAGTAFADDEKGEDVTFYCNFFCGCSIFADPGDDCTGTFCQKDRCTCDGWGIFMYCVE